MKQPPVTLRRNLLSWLLALLVGLWFAAAVAIYFISVHFVNLAYDRALVDSLLSLAAQVNYQDGHVQVELPEPALRILEFDNYDHVYYRVNDAHGRLVSGQSALPAPPPESQPGAAILSDVSVNGTPIRMASMYLSHGGHHYTVQIAETLHKRNQASREILWTIVVPQLVVIALAVLAVWFGVSRGLAPLARLESQVASRSPRDLRPLTEEGAPEEVHSLVRAINILMARLSKTLETQRRFIADAAHQLRTPLAELKTQAELAARQNDPAAARQLLQSMASGIDQSSRLVTQLLALARAENYAERSLDLEPVDLAELARETTSSWVPTALDHNIDLGFEGPEGTVYVMGNALVLKELVSNLLDNAVRYTPGGGSVTARVWTEADVAHLDVEDSGPGIPEQERQRVLEPFYRAPSAQHVDGCGLGLAIVRELALAHNASLRLDTGPGERGLRVQLAFVHLNGTTTLPN